jgi:hypothetical protein
MSLATSRLTKIPSPAAPIDYIAKKPRPPGLSRGCAEYYLVYSPANPPQFCLPLAQANHQATGEETKEDELA